MTLHMTEDICDKLQIFGLRSWDIAKGDLLLETDI